MATNKTITTKKNQNKQDNNNNKKNASTSRSSISEGEDIQASSEFDKYIKILLVGHPNSGIYDFLIRFCCNKMRGDGKVPAIPNFFTKIIKGPSGCRYKIRMIWVPTHPVNELDTKEPLSKYKNEDFIFCLANDTHDISKQYIGSKIIPQLKDPKFPNKNGKIVLINTTHEIKPPARCRPSSSSTSSSVVSPSNSGIEPNDRSYGLDLPSPSTSPTTDGQKYRPVTLPSNFKRPQSPQSSLLPSQIPNTPHSQQYQQPLNSPRNIDNHPISPLHKTPLLTTNLSLVAQRQDFVEIKNNFSTPNNNSNNNNNKSSNIHNNNNNIRSSLTNENYNINNLDMNHNNQPLPHNHHQHRKIICEKQPRPNTTTTTISMSVRPKSGATTVTTTTTTSTSRPKSSGSTNSTTDNNNNNGLTLSIAPSVTATADAAREAKKYQDLHLCFEFESIFEIDPFASDLHHTGFEKIQNWILQECGEKKYDVKSDDSGGCVIM